MGKRIVNVALVTGGPEEEREISLKSSALIKESLRDERLRVFTIDIRRDSWLEMSTGAEVDKNDFSVTIGAEKIMFNIAYLILHGSPAEDGKFQGYLDMLDVPYTGCNAFVSALTFNKIATKKFLKGSDVNIAQSVTIHADTPDDIQESNIPYTAIKKLSYPLFVKPNRAGSSFGVHKVKSEDKLKAALKDAAMYDNEILVEEYLEGREFSCGVIPRNRQPYALPITELIPDGEFFTYEAKYEGKSQEITPADLPEHLEKECRSLSEYLYDELSCSGVVRFDYILCRGKFYFLEVNTIPGLTKASIVPQEIRAAGLSEHDILENVLLDKLGFI